MPNKKIILQSFYHAAGAIAYIALVATFMTEFGQRVSRDIPIVTPMAVLSLFVLSAAVMGALIVARPVTWFVNGQKPEAWKLFIFTLAWLFVFTVATMSTMAILGR